MTYCKPELRMCGDACAVIESIDPKPGIDCETLGCNRDVNSAYDLDE